MGKIFATLLAGLLLAFPVYAGVISTGSTGSGGGGSVTWPSTNDVVISNGTNSPAGVAPVNGDYLTATGGAWVAGNCSGSGAYIPLAGSTAITGTLGSSNGDWSITTAGLGTFNAGVVSNFFTPQVSASLMEINGGSGGLQIATSSSEINITAGSGLLNLFSSNNIYLDSAGGVVLRVGTPLYLGTGTVYDHTGSAGSSGQVLSTTGSTTTWVNASGGGSPGGATNALQYKINSTTFGGAGFQYNSGNLDMNGHLLEDTLYNAVYFGSAINTNGNEIINTVAPYAVKMGAALDMNGSVIEDNSSGYVTLGSPINMNGNGITDNTGYVTFDDAIDMNGNTIYSTSGTIPVGDFINMSGYGIINISDTTNGNSGITTYIGDTNATGAGLYITAPNYTIYSLASFVDNAGNSVTIGAGDVEPALSAEQGVSGTTAIYFQSSTVGSGNYSGWLGTTANAGQFYDPYGNYSYINNGNGYGAGFSVYGYNAGPSSEQAAGGFQDDLYNGNFVGICDGTYALNINMTSGSQMFVGNTGGGPNALLTLNTVSDSNEPQALFIQDSAGNNITLGSGVYSLYISNSDGSIVESNNYNGVWEIEGTSSNPSTILFARDNYTGDYFTLDGNNGYYAEVRKGGGSGANGSLYADGSLIAGAALQAGTTLSVGTDATIIGKIVTLGHNTAGATGVPAIFNGGANAVVNNALSGYGLITIPRAGVYRVTLSMRLIQAAGTSSIFGQNVTLTYSDQETSSTMTFTPALTDETGSVINSSTGKTTNSTNAILFGSALLSCKNATGIALNAGYTSVGSPVMQYSLNYTVEQVF